MPKPLTETSVVFLRPTRSAKWPKISAPTGRPTRVAAKIAPVTREVALADRSGETKYLIAGVSTTTGR